MIIILLFIFGMLIGSFLNVCIYRLPLKKSIVCPSSHCPHCGVSIPFYHNIPLISYIILGGECKNCLKSISLQYPLVEVLSGLLTVLTYLKFGLNAEFIFYLVFIYFLVIIGFIDLKTHLIFNNILFFMLGAGIGINLIFKTIPWIEAGIGFITGGAAMFFIALLGKIIFKKESLGMGDVKFVAVAGFYMGWKMIIPSVYFGFVLTLIAIIILKLISKIKAGDYIPLGPFIASGLLIFVFWGNVIMNYYWELVT